MQLENVKAQVKGQLTPLSDLTNFNDHKEITKVGIIFSKEKVNSGVDIFIYHMPNHR